MGSAGGPCAGNDPAVAGLGVPVGVLPFISCTEAVMLHTEPAAAVITLFLT